MPLRRDESSWGRIILGTASLGLPSYGRRRGLEAPDESEVRAVLDAAWSAGIRAFDTAEAYGTAARKLGDWLRDRGGLPRAIVVTKVDPYAVTDTLQVELACERFVGAASLAVLSHGSIDLAEFERFKSIAESCGAEAGQSVYTAAEVERSAYAGATRVQAPVNVLDVRQLAAAQKAGVALDARSVFLQGVLLDHVDTAERRVSGAGVLARAVQDAAEQVGLPAATALLAGVLALIAPRDRVVIGIDAPGQFEDVAAAIEAPSAKVNHFLEVIEAGRVLASRNLELLDPRAWSAAA